MGPSLSRLVDRAEPQQMVAAGRPPPSAGPVGMTAALDIAPVVRDPGAGTERGQQQLRGRTDARPADHRGRRPGGLLGDGGRLEPSARAGVHGGRRAPPRTQDAGRRRGAPRPRRRLLPRRPARGREDVVRAPVHRAQAGPVGRVRPGQPQRRPAQRRATARPLPDVGRRRAPPRRHAPRVRPADVQEDDPHLIGSSAAAPALRRTLERVAGTDATVLLSSETGTGKEVL